MVFLIVFLPLCAALIAGGAQSKMKPFYGVLIPCICMAISAIGASILFFQFINGKEAFVISISPWLKIADLQFEWALYIDQLSSMMLFVVTIISSVVHFYSIGYMHHDPCRVKFMSFLSLFTFFMLILVSAHNFIQLFFGWEGVGLCSYLLIGFWHKKEAANRASMKAFIVNRVADFCFILAIGAIFFVFGSVEFTDVLVDVHQYEDMYIQFWGIDIHAISLIATLLCIGVNQLKLAFTFGSPMQWKAQRLFQPLSTRLLW